MKRLLSFSLFGQNKIYTYGMLRNLELAQQIYVGWEVAVYVDGTVPAEMIRFIEELGGAVRPMSQRIHPVMQRFLAIADAEYSHVAIRDADSRLSFREFAATQDWIDSGRTLHVMRDHRRHQAAIMGGMWGCKGGAVPDIAEQILASGELSSDYGFDQQWLAENIWPRFVNDSLVHDTYRSGPGERRPFPGSEPRNRFVGQRFDERCRAISSKGRRAKDWYTIRQR